MYLNGTIGAKDKSYYDKTMCRLCFLIQHLSYAKDIRNNEICCLQVIAEDLDMELRKLDRS